ncbi:MAG: c-type cytochrome [Planctomycetaceae bacterium]
MPRVALLACLVLAAITRARETAPALAPEPYRMLGCRECHAGPWRAGPVATAPPLARGREWHLAHLHDPRSVVAGSSMPRYDALFEAHPREAEVRAALAGNEDGILTRAEYGGDWRALLARLDADGDEVITGADAAPRPGAAAEAIVAYLMQAAPPPRTAVAPPPPPARSPAQRKEAADRGRGLFLLHCAGCHGERADGNGPAARFFHGVRPRGFLRGEVRFKSTHPGDPPAESDLFRTIREGLGAAMPAWPFLADGQVWDLVAYLQALHPLHEGGGWKEDCEPRPIEVGEEPFPNSEASAARGAELYRELGCGECHGAEGRGDGPAAASGRGSYGEVVRPADYAKGLRGGGDAARLVRLFLAGVQGTPMPSYRGNFADPADPWHLAHFVQRQVFPR